MHVYQLFHFRFALLVFVRETLGGEGLCPLLYLYQLHILYKLSPPMDLHLDVVAGFATKRDPTRTPSLINHTLVGGENTIWMVGQRGGSEGYFFQAISDA